MNQKLIDLSKFKEHPLEERDPVVYVDPFYLEHLHFVAVNQHLDYDNMTYVQDPSEEEFFKHIEQFLTGEELRILYLLRKGKKAIEIETILSMKHSTTWIKVKNLIAVLKVFAKFFKEYSLYEYKNFLSSSEQLLLQCLLMRLDRFHICKRMSTILDRSFFSGTGQKWESKLKSKLKKDHSHWYELLIKVRKI